ncbi:MAG: hypothetical protein JNL28_07230 [Planctomycetes bacterium]|nr:hypothetical protein [Planctomycetota bacterium]
MNSTTIRTAAAVLGLASATFAQSFNIDVGSTTYPTPSAALGAGAAQPGTWNSKDPGVAGPLALVDLSGAPTGVTFALTAGSGGAFFSNNAGTTGDDEALMDDAQFPSTAGGATWTIAGLAAGTYQVFTYAWAPDSANYLSNVSVNGGPPTCVGGAWPGTYTLGVTHAVDTVVVPPGGSITIAFVSPPCASFHTFNGVQVKLGSTPGVSFCLGDGSGAACPCGNTGATGHGCGSSAFPGGAILTNSGIAGASAGTDTLVLTATDIPGPGLFFQSNGLSASPIPFGDGHLCAQVGIIRLGVVFPASGVASYPGGLTPNPIHIQGGVNNGDTKHYQCWYRSVPGLCSANNYDLTQGLTLVWGP